MERNYQGNDDRDRMLELAHRSPNDYIHVIDLPYRLSSWALNDPDNTRMWFDDLGNLSAWAVMQSPFWTIDYAIDPAHDQTLHNEVLGWAVERASTFRNDTVYGRPAWLVPVHPSKLTIRLIWTGGDSRINSMSPSIPFPRFSWHGPQIC